MVTWPTVPRITCKKNHNQIDYPIAVGHVINFAQDDFENDVLPILDTDGHMTNCTKNSFKKNQIDYDHRAYPSVDGHVTNCI